MTKGTSDLSGVKAGDNVFVVWQRRRGQSDENVGAEEVVRVGRKYAYISRYSREQAFCRKTGRSAHGDSNARRNGYGFDVYLREEDYRKEQARKGLSTGWVGLSI
jgi:hypothetical protein